MDAAIRSVVVGGLQAGVQYRVEVAASTSAGVGVKSEPQTIIIGKRHLLLSITFTVTLHLSGVTKSNLNLVQGCDFFSSVL